MRGGRSGQRGVLHRWCRRVIEDIPLFGARTLVHIEYVGKLLGSGHAIILIILH